MYNPPLTDLTFTLKHLIGLEKLAALPGYDQVSEDLVTAILEEAGKLAAETFAPLNAKGDRQGLKFNNGKVKTPDGFKEAYALYVEGGWNGLAFAEEYGGQNLPFTLSMAVQELLQSANLSLALCTLLNQGAVELLSEHGTQTQKQKYLPNMVKGVWSGTMNLTEPQAGSDVGAVASKAWKDGDSYRVQGQKIFISYGEHDLAENIIHLVLARLPDAPAGTKGLSLFLVPKYLVNADGTLGAENDARCVSIEHKLGQHASPACTLAFGDKGGAVAELVGRENGGIEAMFVMMNNARLGVGIQGLAICERATQAATQFARERVQSRALENPKGPPVAIIEHPDVRRMLLTMRAQTNAARALALQAGLAADQAKRGKNAEAQARVDLLTPIVKAWLTDLANEISSMAVQVYGGMGFVEETGVAQYMRDARVLAIYEGTNGIQANDFLFRKVARDDGKALHAYMEEIRAVTVSLLTEKSEDAQLVAQYLHVGLDQMQRATDYVLKAAKEDVRVAALAAAPYLRLCAVIAGGGEMAKALKAALAQRQDGASPYPPEFLASKITVARFYAESILPQTGGLLPVILAPQKHILEMKAGEF